MNNQLLKRELQTEVSCSVVYSAQALSNVNFSQTSELS